MVAGPVQIFMVKKRIYKGCLTTELCFYRSGHFGSIMICLYIEMLNVCAYVILYIHICMHMA